MSDIELPEKYHNLPEREQTAMKRFVGMGNKLSSWPYMAPELKAPYYDKE